MNSTTRRTGTTARRIAVATALTGAALFTAAAPALADDGPAAAPKLTAATLEAAHEAATESATLDTLSRFFARESAVSRAEAAPRITGKAVPVRTLSAAFVAGKPGAAPSTLDYLATTAVSSDGQKASLWTVPAGADSGGDWQVVNIATGDDEARYTAQGARALPGGIVFREPQIDAWYVHDGSRVLPLDEDATTAVGAKGTTLDAYRTRVRKAYGDKLPGSAYARSGKAGGYGPEAAGGPAAAPGPVQGPVAGQAPDTAAGPALAGAATGSPDTALTAVSTTAGAGALLALALCGAAAVRRRSRTGRSPATDA
ncbi:hypothetical protein PV689_06830 [Streptomyces sp. ATCC51928]|uniref:Uncharacterized protein n=1 Tax=Streptomyces caviscabies TaxID=90079 RepID=A0ABW2M5L7_9ACTN|nr:MULTISPECIES: hypothetical protein [unclassified Streptomyces]MDX3501624.1 hypothetical protein [Streptomyces sp. ATCC51928]MDX5521258.1 hypothetical protein [Streptomyces sp. DE06-01C]